MNIHHSAATTGAMPVRFSARRLHVLAAAFLLAFAGMGYGSIADPTEAHAATVDMTCAAAFGFTLAPGVTLAPQNIDALGSALLSNCVLGDGSTSPHGIGSVDQARGSATNATCANLAITGKNGTIDWADGTKSSFDFTVAITPLAVDSPIQISATITDGLFKGDTINAVPLIVTLQGNCATGVTQLTANASAVTFTH
ncbi:hypothetical protein [Nocardia terpenica]|uniref:Uncharacterized protein n=1 Tax=Nocardia terpenica TaxID=455432 RepID=A0A164P1J0_9NOCA|nr:hypothetical protein [Nocardia terpenica]KZM74997.1 hypothetical protein AWN90_23645 [Nocardia terpenica]NQE93330.1 hypothetical protein [Nocardia terpenica]